MIYDSKNKYILGLTMLIYIIFQFNYVSSLNKLNDFLLSNSYDSDPWKLIQYNSYQPLKYLGIAFILVGLSFVGLVVLFKYLKNYETDFIEIILSLLFMIILVISIVSTVKAISIPILQAVAIMVGGTLALGYSLTSSN